MRSSGILSRETMSPYDVLPAVNQKKKKKETETEANKKKNLDLFGNSTTAGVTGHCQKNINAVVNYKYIQRHRDKGRALERRVRIIRGTLEGSCAHHRPTSTAPTQRIYKQAPDIVVHTSLMSA